MSYNEFGGKPHPLKQRIRERIWKRLQDARVDRFPGAWGRIPNFVGAEKAAQLAAGLEVFRSAKVIKANPDTPQKPLRKMALEAGKIVYMAVPRLRSLKCFVMLDPSSIPKHAISKAATIKGAFRYGKPVAPWEMEPVDLVVAGSVAVNRKGQRIGKGGGYSDLEFAIARHYGLIGEETPILTTVHPLQILDEEFPWKPHDIPVDYIVTPDEVIKTEGVYPKPRSILWNELTREQLDRIPILVHILSQLEKSQEGKTKHL